MSHNPVVADHAAETYPDFAGKIHDSYITGYDPVSLTAPHSSLVRVWTWVGMGLIMSVLPAIGIFTWGLGTTLYTEGTTPDSHATVYLIIGGVATIATAIAAVVAISIGRKSYKAYRTETGRIN